MADFGAPVAQNVNVNPAGGLDMLNKLLNAKQQQQNLQTGLIQQQGLQAQTQALQQTTQQRAAQANFFKDWDPTQHVGDDGTLDLSQAFSDPKLRKAAGDQFPDVAQKLIDLKRGQLQAKGQLAMLNGTVLGQIGQVVGGLREDADVRAGNDQGYGKVGNALSEVSAMGGPDAQRIVGIFSKGIMGAPRTKGANGQSSLWNGVNALQLQAMDAATQAGKQAPSYANVGSGLIQNNPQAAGGGMAGNLINGIPPGWSAMKDAYGRTFAVNNQDPSQVRLIGGGGTAPTSPGAPPAAAPSGGAPQSPSGFVQPVAGQDDAVKNIQGAREVSASGALQTARNVNAHLLELSASTNTSPLAQTTQSIAASLGLPAGTKMQEIGAYLDRQAILQMHSMGTPNTNAAMEAAGRMAGTPAYTKDALQEKIKFADALNSGTLAYTKGLNAAVGTGPNPDLSHYNAFRAAWGQNFDPDIYRAEDAQRRHDNAELQAIRKRVGPNGMKELAIKSANLRQLEQGVIPGG